MNIDTKNSKQNISKTISVTHAIYHDEVAFTSEMHVDLTLEKPCLVPF